MHTYGQELVAALPQVFEELRALCAGADMLICGRLQPAGRMVHELTGIPFVSIQTAYLDLLTPRGYRQAAAASSAEHAREGAALVNPFRVKLGLPPITDPFALDALSSQLAIFAISRHICPPPPGWPAHYHMTGFFFLEDDDWQPSAELETFLATGEPPVVISFGSMTHDDPTILTDLLLEAIAQVGCRAIIQQGWSSVATRRSLPPNVYAAGYIPHYWLFTRARCVVHHGGAGTTAAAMRAGRPSVVVPHGWDQPAWATFVHGLGCAGPPIPYHQLTAGQLSQALVQTLSTPSYSQAAAALAEKIWAEQGVQKARQLIEQLGDMVGWDQHGPATAPDGAGPANNREEKILRRKQYQQQQRTRKV